MKKDAKQNNLRKVNDTAPRYAAIDLGTTSCRLIIASPTPTSFRVVETYTKVTKLGEGIIKENVLSAVAVKRTLAALKVSSAILEEYKPITATRFVATAVCRRAKNCEKFIKAVKDQTGIDIEVISEQEESRLSTRGCVPLLNRNIKRGLIIDIGGGSTEISLARVTHSGKIFSEGFVSLPYGVVTVSEALPEEDLTALAYDAIGERTKTLLEDFDKKFQISEGLRNNEIQVIGTSGTATVLGAVHLNLNKYNRNAVDGLSIITSDIFKAINKIKSIGTEGRKKHPCIGAKKSALTLAGCAIIEGLFNFLPIPEITIADRGIREGLLLDMMHQKKPHSYHKNKNRNNYRKKKKNFIKFKRVENEEKKSA